MVTSFFSYLILIFDFVFIFFGSICFFCLVIVYCLWPVNEIILFNLLVDDWIKKLFILELCDINFLKNKKM